MKEKYTVGHHTLLGMLYYHWTFDTSTYPIERERVQLAAILLFLGKRKRPAPKRITLYENRQCPAMCPIVHFLALAFADNAFHPELYNLGLTPAKLHSFRNPEGRITIESKFWDEILDVPLFRAWHSTLEGVQVHAVKPLSAKNVNRESKRLGQQAGLPHAFSPYCLRREVGTELTDE